MIPRRVPAWWKVTFIAAYFVGIGCYFMVQHLGIGRETIMPWTALDLAVPAGPELMLIYLANLATVTLPFLAIGERAAWVRAVAGYAATTSACVLVHLLWPTAIDNRAVDLREWSFVQTLGGRGCAFPSLHAATAVYAAGLWQRLSPKLVLRILAWTWTTLVLVSCVSTRQHGILDLLAGAVVAVVALRLVPIHPREPVHAST